MIVEKCVEQGLQAPSFEEGANFVVTLWRNGKSEKDLEKGTEKGIEKITENQRLILDNIALNPYITINELVPIVGIVASKVKENLAKLKSKGLIQRIVADKGGCWEIVE
jgi:predicted HTH transcriptional regulator